jgi:MoxR-like ATPase
MRLSVGYPSPADERRLLVHLQHVHPIHQLEPISFYHSPAEGGVLSAPENGQAGAGLRQLVEFQRQVWDVHVDDSLADYIIRLVTATRTHPDLLLGGSPRASLALFKASQAYAAVHGRDHVIPDDIKHLVPFTLAHRLIARPEAELRGRTAVLILQEILAATTLELSL